MDHALVIGGTRFIGRHLVDELLAHDYRVTLFNRGRHENPFAETENVEVRTGNRRTRSDLEAVASEIDPTAVFDCVAYYPDDVRNATELFDPEAYVYISSGAAYGREEIPKREAQTPLERCSPEAATSDDPETYGARKAEGDRVVKEAAANGVRAMSIRPPIVYGPADYTERLAFWIDRVNRFDRIIVPGDGTNVWHRAYVEDVASGMRIIAERGQAGEAYNVGDRRLTTLAELVELLAEIQETTVDIQFRSPDQLEAGGIDPESYPFYRSYPHILSTAKLTELGWTATDRRDALTRTITAHHEAGRTGEDRGPDRAAEAQLL